MVARCVTRLCRTLGVSVWVSFRVSEVSPLNPCGEDFLYVFEPGRHGPDAPPLPPAMRSLPLRSASAPGGWRATQ